MYSIETKKMLFNDLLAKRNLDLYTENLLSMLSQNRLEYLYVLSYIDHYYYNDYYSDNVERVMKSSVESCLYDARECMSKNLPVNTRSWLIKASSYAFGVFSEHHKHILDYLANHIEN